MPLALPPPLTAALRRAGTCAAALLLAACAAPVAPPPVAPAAPGPIVVRGELSYPQRIALPSQAVAVVELRDLQGGPALVATQRQALQGRQVPLAFSLQAPRAALAPGHAYGLRAAIVIDGLPAWASDEVPVALTADAPDAPFTLPGVRLRALEQQSFAARLRCGKREGDVVATDNGARLTLGHEVFELRQLPAASGARYDDPRDPTTTFWGKGRRATLVIRGEKQPTCTVHAPSSLLLRASGNEPGWSLRIDKGTLGFVTQDGAAPVAAPVAVLPQGADASTYVADTGTALITVTARDQLCKDTMSGMPYPTAVTVAYAGRSYRGCGGDTADLLRDTRWQVTELDGEPLAAAARATISFGDSGQLAGQSACNTFRGRYAIKGEGLSVSRLAATRKACAAAVLKHETALLKLLGAAQQLDFRDDGALVLRTPDARSLVAQKAP